MTPTVKKRLGFIINLAYLAIILALFYLFFKYLFWIAAPFLFAFILAVILQRPIRWADKKTKKKHHALWSILFVFISLIIIIGPVVLILSACAKQISNFGSYLASQLTDLPGFLRTLEAQLLKIFAFLPEGIYSHFSTYVTDVFAKLIDNFDLSALGINAGSVSSGVASSVSGIYGVIKSVPSFLLGIVIGIVAWIFMTKDYDKIVRFIQLQFPENKKNTLVEIKQVFTKTIFKMIKAYALIMFITFCELLLGFSILKLIGVLSTGYIIMIAVGIAIFDILPVAGSGGILIPWSLITLVLGNYGQAIGIIVIYIIMTCVRQYMEPKIVGDSLGVHPLLTLGGLYFGLKLFGFIGMFIVPISIMTLKAFNDTGRIHIWKTTHPMND